MTDYELMGAALAEAEKAAALGEVPVGAVIAKDGEIIAAAHNTRETEKNALHHAELLAIDAACKKLGGWRLWQCELFVTLEPCPMCSGAILNSRVKRVVYGAADTKAGCCGSVTDLFALPFNTTRWWSGASGPRKRRLFCRRFSSVCGSSGLQGRSGNRRYRDKTSPNDEKSVNCVKKARVPTFFFRQFVLYYSMVTCRNHAQEPAGAPQDRT